LTLEPNFLGIFQGFNLCPGTGSHGLGIWLKKKPGYLQLGASNRFVMKKK
jgi:hypothetical protein